MLSKGIIPAIGISGGPFCLYQIAVSVPIEHNLHKLRVCGQPVAEIKAIHTGPRADQATAYQLPPQWAAGEENRIRLNDQKYGLVFMSFSTAMVSK